MLRQVCAEQNVIDGRAAKVSIATDMRFCVCFARVRLELTESGTRGDGTQRRPLAAADTMVWVSELVGPDRKGWAADTAPGRGAGRDDWHPNGAPGAAEPRVGKLLRTWRAATKSLATRSPQLAVPDRPQPLWAVRFRAIICVGSRRRRLADDVVIGLQPSSPAGRAAPRACGAAPGMVCKCRRRQKRVCGGSKFIR